MPKQPDVQVNLNFYPVQCQVKYGYASSALNSDEWLIVSFLHYAARYLYIADERQRQAMSTLLPILANCKTAGDVHQVADEVYVDVADTLTQEERGALAGLFGAFPPTWLQSDDAVDVQQELFTSYVYSMKMTEHGIQTHLELGMADMILLPLSVCHFYCYVITHLTNKARRKLASEALKDLVELFYMNEQDTRWLQTGAIMIVRKYPA